MSNLNRRFSTSSEDSISEELRDPYSPREEGISPRTARYYLEVFVPTSRMYVAPARQLDSLESPIFDSPESPTFDSPASPEPESEFRLRPRLHPIPQLALLPITNMAEHTLRWSEWQESQTIPNRWSTDGQEIARRFTQFPPYTPVEDEHKLFYVWKHYMSGDKPS
jgi:hypothetical protein